MGNEILKLNKNTNGLCGGDWISASDGTGATLSCVVFNDSKYYGLTAGHVFDEAPNSNVYTFVKKEGVNAPDGKEEDEFKAKTGSKYRGKKICLQEPQSRWLQRCSACFVPLVVLEKVMDTGPHRYQNSNHMQSRCNQS